MTITSVCGLVSSGKKRGREIGYPTANVCIPEQQQKDLEEGTYAGKVLIGDHSYKAAIFIPEARNIIEAHILDFEANLYDQEICIKVGQRLRDNKKFENLDELKKQITKDIQEIHTRD